MKDWHLQLSPVVQIQNVIFNSILRELIKNLSVKIALGYLPVLQAHDTYVCYTSYFYALMANWLGLVFPIIAPKLPT